MESLKFQLFILGTTSEKIKSKKRDFGPFSLDPYPPTINRDILIRDIFDFIFSPTLLYKIGICLKKNLLTKFIFNDYKLHILKFWALAQEPVT